MAVSKNIHSYLALGDSYTIGEGVPLLDSFPYQVLYHLRKNGWMAQAPEIVAKTGWTTSELLSAIASQPLLTDYTIVSLLIGVNNQYRGLNIGDYENEFEQLIKICIELAGNIPEHVFVLSIPDWGCTPFAKEKDAVSISRQIDGYNFLNRQITQKYKAHYLDITVSGRQVVSDAELIATDGLHPSAKEYKKWATLLSNCITNQFT